MLRQRNAADYATCGLRYMVQRRTELTASQHDAWGQRFPDARKVEVWGYGGEVETLTGTDTGLHFGFAADNLAPIYSGGAFPFTDEMDSDYHFTGAPIFCWKQFDEPIVYRAVGTVTSNDFAGGTWTYGITLRVCFVNETAAGAAGAVTAFIIRGMILYRMFFSGDGED